MDQKLRVAVINPAKCKPKDCGLECKTNCPVVRMGKLCVVVSKKDRVASISESLCNPNCNICTKKCPFGAISMVNIPNGKQLLSETSHRYSANSFKLHRLPMPRLGEVLGIIGTNGIGKSTALKILGGKLKPNLGRYSDPPEWDEIITNYRGSDLQNYFVKLRAGKLKCLIKPQYVDALQSQFKTRVTVKGYLDSKNQREQQEFEKILYLLDLTLLYNEERDIVFLSGGEVQRFAIAAVCIQKADVYMFDEPSSFLDVKQRLNAATCIRSLVSSETYVVCVEHDLALLDYLSDSVCCMYGTPSIYGIVTMPYSVREGINIFLQGYLPAENMRFRDTELTFKMLTQASESETLITGSGDSGNTERKAKYTVTYPTMTKTLDGFKLNICPGTFGKSEITVLLGQNGTGKSTLVKMFAGLKGYTPDKLENGDEIVLPQLIVSYKPQTITPSFRGTVRDILYKKLGDTHMKSHFQTEIFKPLGIAELMDLDVQTLSGGELQRLAIVLCLGKPADIYLIDEPSAYLDSEQRIIAAKVIKRFIMQTRKTGFIVEHDFIMATYLADRVIYYSGVPSVECTANSPESLLSGMNKFLHQLNITFRRDPVNWRPRINKLNSIKDVEQKLSGNYFFLETV